MARKRSAKLKVEWESKTLGLGYEKRTTHKPGKQVDVERNDSNPGQYILWFSRNQIGKVDAIKLYDVVEFVDGQRY